MGLVWGLELLLGIGSGWGWDVGLMLLLGLMVEVVVVDCGCGSLYWIRHHSMMSGIQQYWAGDQYGDPKMEL